MTKPACIRTYLDYAQVLGDFNGFLKLVKKYSRDM